MGGCRVNAGAGEKKTTVREMAVLVGMDSGDLVFRRCRNLYDADQRRLEFNFRKIQKIDKQVESG